MTREEAKEIWSQAMTVLQEAQQKEIHAREAYRAAQRVVAAALDAEEVAWNAWPHNDGKAE